MEHGGRQQYQDPQSYYYTHHPSQPPPPPASQQQSGGPGSSQHGHEPSHGYPSIYTSSASIPERPSPPPTPLSATTSTGAHMSAPMLPHANSGRSMSDSIGMYHHPARSNEASGSRRTTSPMEGSGSGSGHNNSGGGNRPASIKRVGGKANVSSACAPCKKAHLACDVMRPCKRCVNMGKEELCEDVPVGPVL